MRVETYRQRLWDFAVGQYGYVRTADARDLEIPAVELAKLAARGMIRNVAYGLYRFDDLPPTRFDRFFEAVARVGEGAHLTGDAVLALHELGQVNPNVVRVGTPRRVRAEMPGWIAVVRETLPDGALTSYESIPSATVAHAIRSCRDTVMSDRLLDAVEDGRRQGLLTPAEQRAFRTDLEGAT